MGGRGDFARRVLDVELSYIRYMSMLADKVPDAVSLGQGIPFYDLLVKEELARAVLEVADINKYSLENGIPALREEIAKKLRRTRGIDVDPETEIYVTGGAASGLYNAIMAVVNPGDSVILPSPTYSPIISDIKLAEGTPIHVPLIEEEGWVPDIGGLERAIRECENPKAIVYCNPSNPTGTVYDEEFQRSIAHLALENGLFIIVDETYDFLTYDGHKHFSLASLIPSIPELKHNLITIFSFSKEFAMTGLRVGFTHAEGKTIGQVMKVHDATDIAAPTPSQYAALFALQNYPDIGKAYREEYAERRELICHRLDELNEFFEYHRPMGSYYIFARVKPIVKALSSYETTVDLSKRILYEGKVVTIPGIEFGPTGEDHLRFGFPCTKEEINIGFDRLKNFLQSLKAKQ